MGEQFKIVRDMSVPVPRRGRAKKAVDDKYPFKDMAVGDSFIVVGKENIQKTRNAANSFAKEHGPKWKFITRDISAVINPDTGEQYGSETYGVWRAMPTTATAVTEPRVVVPTAGDNTLPVPVIVVNGEPEELTQVTGEPESK